MTATLFAFLLSSVALVIVLGFTAYALEYDANKQIADAERSYLDLLDTLYRGLKADN